MRGSWELLERAVLELPTPPPSLPSLANPCGPCGIEEEEEEEEELFNQRSEEVDRLIASLTLDGTATREM